MKYQPPFGSSDPNAPYLDRSNSNALRGSVPPAAAIEHTQREIVAALIANGLVPSSTDLTQLAQAIGILATTERAGRVELATLAEVLARSRGDLAVTPESLANFVVQNAFVGNRRTIFATAGSYTFTVQANVFVLDVEAWGAGGGGGGCGSSGAVSAASGAGSGGYGRRRMTVTPGQQISLTVGQGGGGGSSGGGNGGNGGTTSFGGVISAVGGSAGSGAQNGIVATAGQGGSVTGADISIPGRGGQLGLPVGGSGAIGGFGAGSYGSSPTGPNTADGQAGAFPGGGGSGGAVTNGGVVGGAGAPGCIIVSY